MSSFPSPLSIFPSVVCSAAFLLSVSAATALDQVRIALVGEIEKKCVLSGTLGGVDLGDVTATSRRDLTLGVNCNTPFQYTVISANGGLRHAGNIAKMGQFTELLPYRVNVSVPTDSGRAVFACDSGGMTAATPQCAPADSAGGIAVGQTAALSLSWQRPQLPMLAGRFEDELTISVSVKP